MNEQERDGINPDPQSQQPDHDAGPKDAGPKEEKEEVGAGPSELTRRLVLQAGWTVPLVLALPVPLAAQFVQPHHHDIVVDHNDQAHFDGGPHVDGHTDNGHSDGTFPHSDMEHFDGISHFADAGEFADGVHTDSPHHDSGPGHHDGPGSGSDHFDQAHSDFSHADNPGSHADVVHIH